LADKIAHKGGPAPARPGGAGPPESPGGPSPSPRPVYRLAGAR